MFLGIEIGGTKLQLAVGAGDGSPPAKVDRYRVDAAEGAHGILQRIERSGHSLLNSYPVDRIGIGFGGPVDVAAGRVITSHQIQGWDDMPLVSWCERALGLAVRIDNDCNVAALAEAQFGAGRGAESVFFVTVGTGIGGGLVVERRLFGRQRPAIAEIGHLRPGLDSTAPGCTVESVASGWGIAATMRQTLSQIAPRLDSSISNADASRPPATELHASDAARDHADMMRRSGGQLQRITAEMVAAAAAEHNRLAQATLDRAVTTLGWALAQMITLLAPEVVVVGGGVSQIPDEIFLSPLQTSVHRFVFPPLADSYRIVPAALGELVVVQGALSLAAEQP